MRGVADALRAAGTACDASAAHIDAWSPTAASLLRWACSAALAASLAALTIAELTWRSVLSFVGGVYAQRTTTSEKGAEEERGSSERSLARRPEDRSARSERVGTNDGKRLGRVETRRATEDVDARGHAGYGVYDDDDDDGDDDDGSGGGCRSAGVRELGKGAQCGDVEPKRACHGTRRRLDAFGFPSLTPPHANLSRDDVADILAERDARLLDTSAQLARCRRELRRARAAVFEARARGDGLVRTKQTQRDEM